jgi:hypothetical protein
VQPREFNQLIDASEALAADVSRAVFDATSTVSKETGASTRTDAATPERLAELRNRIADSLANQPAFEDPGAAASAAIESAFGVAPGTRETSSEDTSPKDKSRGKKPPAKK